MISGVSGAPAHSTSWTSAGRRSAARSRYGRPFWRVIRPTNTTEGRSGSSPRAARRRPRRGDVLLALRPAPAAQVDPVVDHHDVVGVQRRVAAQDVLAHARAHRDDPRGALVGGLLGPGRQRVATTELLGLPRPQRLQAVRADDVRHVVQQTRQVPGHVRVPGVGVHQVGPRAVLRDLQVHPERGQGRVRARQLDGHVVAGHPLGVPRRRRSTAPARRRAGAAPRTARRRGRPRRRRRAGGTRG